MTAVNYGDVSQAKIWLLLTMEHRHDTIIYSNASVSFLFFFENVYKGLSQTDEIGQGKRSQVLLSVSLSVNKAP